VHFRKLEVKLGNQPDKENDGNLLKVGVINLGLDKRRDPVDQTNNGKYSGQNQSRGEQMIN
jgi:hypothetical protein